MYQENSLQRSKTRSKTKIEREALAVVFMVTRLKQLIHGRQFTLQMDHKILKYLFPPDEEIPKTAGINNIYFAKSDLVTQAEI